MSYQDLTTYQRELGQSITPSKRLVRLFNEVHYGALKMPLNVES